MLASMYGWLSASFEDGEAVGNGPGSSWIQPLTARSGGHRPRWPKGEVWEGPENEGRGSSWWRRPGQHLDEYQESDFMYKSDDESKPGHGSKLPT